MKHYRIFVTVAVLLALVLVTWGSTALVHNASAQGTAAPRNAEPKLDFVRLDVREDGKLASHTLRRAKVPGGWLVSIDTGNRPDPSVGLAFVPDADHIWGGDSLP